MNRLLVLTLAAIPLGQTGGAVTRTSSTQERVKRAAGSGATVIPWREATIPKLELFYLSSRTPAGKTSGRGIAVVDGQLPWLEGERAMEAVVAAGVADAPTLARAVILLLLDRGQLLEKPEDRRPPLAGAEKEVFAPPERRDGRLEFFYFAGRPGVLKVQVELATWKTTTTHIGQLIQARADPIDLAKAWLKDSGEHFQARGVDALVAHCTDPRAPALLLETLAAHPKASTRALAAGALARCRAPSAVAALATALAGEKAVEVRKAAVEALGLLADPAARPALEQAAKDDPDANVRAWAESTLGGLPKR
jgi:hypothetical protein